MNIETMRSEAAEAGDLDAVRLCDHAMGRIERRYRGRVVVARTVRVKGRIYTQAQARRADEGMVS